ncbi:integrase core domain protein [Oesophagostomum dentatum]|uniref:RNA-directed DNA polymerase n=1 Tax=Oesophagostomum dentatum TaxID=61180 RepID=A0A0B1ST07_OESDE|nr:integrase core domain protein [Oesophagostomum dentatum]
MRNLLNRSDISASHLGSVFFQIHRCVSIPPTAVHFLTFNDTCYEFPIVQLRLPSGSFWQAFLDPATGVLYNKAGTVRCEDISTFFLTSRSSIQRFSPFDGTLLPVPLDEVTSISSIPQLATISLSPQLTIFHNLVLTNLSEFNDEALLQEMWTTRDHEKIIEHFSKVTIPSATGTSYATHERTDFHPPWSLLSFSLFDVWVSTCCVLITACVIKSLALLYIRIYHPAWLTRHNITTYACPPAINTVVSSAHRLPAVSTPVDNLPSPLPLNLDISQVDIDVADIWPPRATTIPMPMSVLSINSKSPFFVTQIPVHVNGIPMLALIDTGAGISVASQSILPLLGIFTMDPTVVPSAMGMAGVPVKFVGSARVILHIGTHSFDQVVHFTEAECVPRKADAYNIILGNDVLQRLPPWTLDYGKRLVSIDGEVIPILTFSPQPSEATKLSDANGSNLATLRARHTTVLAPASETLVTCYLANASPDFSTFLTYANVMSDNHIFVAPAVIRQNSSVSSNDPGADCSTFRHTLQLDLSRAEVTPSQRNQLHDLFAEFHDRISSSSYDLGSYDHTLIHIKTTTDIPPTRFRPTRIPTRFQKELDEHINKLLASGRIVESDTPWIHNTVLVKKKDGSLRVCLDFRPLNAITIPDRYPLPRIEDLLEKVAGNKFYTSFDLASGYMQLLLAPESQAKCGWATHRGIYQFVYLPFGLRNAGAYFCRAMSRVLAGLEANCLAYIDDIIVFNNDFDSHLASLRKVLERFRIFNIKVSGKKLTSIAQSKITFLGHEISGNSYFPADRNVKAINDMPTPTSTKQVKSFLGMANFFRKFIKGFASLAAPLYDLCKNNVAFEWGESQNNAFLNLKKALTSKPCLAFPKNQDFILHTDGSKTAIGAALFQTHNNTDKLVAVGYFSKMLSPSQRKWSPTHIELFAMISALRFFRTTIYGNHTTIFSDHKPLTFLLRQGKTHDNLARWAVELQSYDISIQYQKGTSNVVADHLSRNSSENNVFVDGSPECEDLIEFPRCLAQNISTSTAVTNVQPYPLIRLRPYDVLIEQQHDPLCKTIMFFLESGTWPANTDDELKTSCLNIAEKCTIKKNGCLYFTAAGNSKTNCRHDPLFVPIRLREPICVALHQSPTAGGHFNWRKTLAKIKRRFYWPQMKEDIFKYVRSCDQCQRKRPHPFNKEKLLPVQTDAVFARVYLDLSGPYRTSARGNKYILCLIDHFTKYVVSSAISDCTAVTVANAIVSECILKYGAMTELVSDNASYLKGDLLAELGKLLRIGHYFTTPYHHEGNGACERVFATFQEMLRTYISSNQLDWDLFLPACTFAYNTSVHSSTNETPFFLLFGRDPVFNIDLLIQHKREGHIPDGTDSGIYKESLINALHSAWLAAFTYNEKRNRIMKRQYDKSHLPTASIQLGDRVYLRDFAPKPGLSQKLCYPWLGQFRVIGIDPPHLTLVSITSPQSKPRKVHMNQVKRCFELSGPVFTCPWIPSPEEKALTLAKACNHETLGYSHALTDPVFTIRSSSPQSQPTRSGMSARQDSGDGDIDSTSSPRLEATTPSDCNEKEQPGISSDSGAVAHISDTSSSDINEATPDTAPSPPRPPSLHALTLDDAPGPSSKDQQPLSSSQVVGSADEGNTANYTDQEPRSDYGETLSDETGLRSTSFTKFRTEKTIPSPAQAQDAPVDGAPPPKRERRAFRPAQGIQPHPAYPPLLEATPEGYVHRLVGQHPWAQLVIPLHERQDVSEDQITSELPAHVYRHLGNGGYLGGRFVRSLFPRKFQGIISPSNPLPFIELMRLDHAIAFRRHADSIIREVMRRGYRLVDPDLPRASKDRPPTLIVPPRRDDVFPVLYQVVAKNRGQGVIVEAKDFFIPGPDHMELHCVVFDQFAVNILNHTRGFDLQQVSIKDFIWVYSLKPTLAAYQYPEEALRQSRSSRTTAMNTGVKYFFRVHEFIFVTPFAAAHRALALVLSVPRRGYGEVNNLRVALEGCPEAITIPPSICEGFRLSEIENDDILSALVRANVSCAMRFSAPPISKDAQHILVNFARNFLPASPPSHCDCSFV